MTGSSAKGKEAWTDEKHPASTAALIASLNQLRVDNPKAVRPNVHHYPAKIYASDDKGEGSSTQRDRRITSWKMTEHLYFSANNNFPTLARGLFTEEIADGEEVPLEASQCQGEWTEDMPRERIVARGYDKFFNIDEVEWTNWDNMKRHTRGPYRLTLKSNGCLILISALTPTHVLVASKHSLGTTTDEQEKHKLEQLADGIAKIDVKGNKKGKGKVSPDADAVEDAEAQAHAEVGRRWLRRTLKASGKTEADLAARLWEKNLTAVLELCDDSFEEHVIATPEYWTGLHLHGLNHNTPHFSTASPAEVTALANEFGFIPTKYVEREDLDAVKDFTDEVAQSGAWEGDQIEGFVVRCEVGNETGPGKPPYRPGAPFFFKVKFDEPYLLYRQWREMTRTMLPLLQQRGPQAEADIWKKVRGRIKRPEIAVYADWCDGMLKSEPTLFDHFDKGVVRVRERFLHWTETPEGQQAWTQAKEGKYKLKGGKPARLEEPEIDRTTLPKKYLIVPVAVPGCGKTLIGVALTHLFGIGHTQSDDVTTKKTAPAFLRNIVGLLKTKDVVYADRNNHVDKHYNELAELVNDKALKPYNLRLVAVIWDVKSQPYHRLLRLCSERVVKRGDNHQTLRPDLTVEAEHEAVVGQFLRNWTAPDLDLFDRVINLEVQHTPKTALTTITNGLVEIIGLLRPSEADIDAALAVAEGYQVTTPYHAISRIGKAIRYFAVAPEIDLPATVTRILASTPAPAAQALYDHLLAETRLTAKPHVTLAHEKTVAAEKDAAGENAAAGVVETLWNTCKSLAETGLSPLYNFNITFLAWDDRVMAMALDALRPKEGTGEAPELVLPEETSLYLHVTVGTKSEDIAPFESRGVIRIAKEAIAAGNTDGIAGEAVEGGGRVSWIRVDEVQSEGRIRGMW